jgi:hypothetical protein
MNDMTKAWLISPPVQAVVEAQREQARHANWVLESLESEIAKHAHFYMEVGPCTPNKGGTVRRQNGRYITTRTVQDSHWKEPEDVETYHDTLVAALTALVEDK